MQYSDQGRLEIGRFGSVVGWAAFLCFDLIILGSLVRATDSGLACPDWPLCYDQLVPAMNFQIFVEWFHRLSALVLGVLLCVILARIIRNQLLRKAFGKQFSLAIGLFLSQCILGGLTVLKLLDPTIVSFHLINALLFFALLLWISLKASTISKADLEDTISYRIPPSTHWMVISVLILVTGQIFLGGMVSTNHAGLVCSDFPTCYGRWFPFGSFLIYLQMYHRYLAFFLIAISVALNLMTFRVQMPPLSKFCLRLTPSLLLSQILLGLVNIFYALPVWASVAHLANALIIFTALFVTAVQLKLSSYSIPRSKYSPASKNNLIQAGDLEVKGANL